MEPICMTEEYWANSPLSIARHYGGIKISGQRYLIVNKEGKDIFQCSAEASRKGRAMAIDPGEPADLVRQDFIPLYRKLGRARFIEILKETQGQTDKEIKKRMKEAIVANQEK